MTKRIPIKQAKDISVKYDLDQVIIVAWDKELGTTHIVTYGKTFADCEQAAIGGNFIKKALGWPDELCHDEPARIRRKKSDSSNKVTNR